MPLGNPIRKQNESRVVSVLATEGQTVFTVQGGYIINQISVFRNGVRLSNSEDFTAGDGSTVTLNNAANIEDRIEFHIFDRFTVQNAIVSAASTQTISGDVVVNGKIFGNLDVPSINTGIVTATQLDLNGSLDVSSTSVFNDDVTFTGAAANITFDKSVDDLIFNDGAKAAFGTSSDLIIYHDGTLSKIQNSSSGQLELISNDIDLRSSTGDEHYFTAQVGGAATVFYDNSVRIATSPSGVDVTGTLNVTGVSTFAGDINLGDAVSDTITVVGKVDSDLSPSGSTRDLGTSTLLWRNLYTSDGVIASDDIAVHADDSNTKIRFPAVDTITAETGGSERIRIGTDGTIEVQDSVTLSTNAPSVKGKIRISGVSDATTAGGIEFHTSSGGGGGYGSRITADASGNMHFLTRSNNVAWGEKLRITSDGDIVTQGLTGTSFDNDGNNAKVLEVTGDGTVGEYGVVNISGNQNSSAVVGAIKFLNRENSNSSSGSNANSKRLASIDCFADTSDSNGGDDCGGVLRFVTKADGGGGAEQMRIRSWGDVNISNRLNVAGISTFTGNVFMPDNAEIRLGASGDMQFFHHSSTGESRIYNSNAAGINIITDLINIKNNANNETMFKATNGGAVELYWNDDKKFETAAIGNYAKSIMPSSDNTYDLGQNVGRWRNLYISDQTGGNGGIFIGASNDLELYHEGSFNFIVNHNSKNLVIQAKDGENAILTVPDGEVALYHNNHKTCQTTSAGFSIIDGTGANAELRVTATGTNRADLMALATGTGNANLWLDASNGDLSGADYAVVFQNNATLDLEIVNYANDVIIKTRNSSLGSGSLNTAIHCHENGAIDFRHDGSLVAQTITNGIQLYTGSSSHLGFLDVHTATWQNYTHSVDLRWYDDVNNDNVMELSQAGNLNIDGSYSNSGVDYAEYFESTDGSAIPVGTTVVLDNGKVRAATSSETPIGVIRPKTSGTSVTGGVNQLNWQGKYLVDDYDGQVMESAVHCTWDDANGDHQQCWKDRPPTGVTIPSDAEERTMDRPKLNPLFDESKTYVPRSERDEWNCVGLLGQIPITKGQPTSSNWIKMKDRSATVELWMVK